MIQVNYDGNNNEHHVNGGNYQMMDNERVEQPPMSGRGNEDIQEMLILDSSSEARVWELDEFFSLWSCSSFYFI